MQKPILFDSRRRFIRGMAFGVAGFSVPGLFNVPGLFAEQLMLTPSQGEGPFYPDHMPLDTDNDLLTVNDSITPAVGQITHLGGRLLSAAGEPIRNTLVEIWQVDNNGVYLHTDSNHDTHDQNFQGFGRFLTGSTGEYYFRTIRPVVYGNRTSHIHFAIKMKGHEKWTTQLYVKGEPQNKNDRALNRIRNPKEREAVTVDFAPMHGSQVGELAAQFDIVLGFTPEA